MLIISVEIMKTIDEREIQKTTKEKQKKAERSKGNRSYSDRVRAKWFCCAFMLGFPQLICKASLIFKSNLESAVSIILKQRELYEPKHPSEECRYSKIWDLLSFLTRSSLAKPVVILKRRLKNVVIFVQTILSFVLSRKIYTYIFQMLIKNKNYHFAWHFSMLLLILGTTCSYIISLFKTMKYTWKLVATMVVEVSRCHIKLQMFTIQTAQIILLCSASLKPKIITAT